MGMLSGLTGWHMLLVLAVILLLFGATKLPALARSLGQSARAFKGEMRGMREDELDNSGASTALRHGRAEPSPADGVRSRGDSAA